MTTVSTLSATPETSTVSGVAPYAEPTTHPQLALSAAQVFAQALADAVRPDPDAWLSHVQSASACMRPVRLAGTIATIEAATGRLLAERSTADMPDGVIYKPCGNRRATVCPSCSKLYQRDAYHVVRSGLVGGRGVPEQVAQHPAVFPTLTAPSFGPVHTRTVRRHTCARRTDCDCRPEPCHARRDLTVCEHGQRLVCFARHEASDRQLGTPLCADCYDYDAQAVWNVQAGELWRRTTEHLRKRLRSLARQRGIPFVATVSATGKVRMVPPVRLQFGKAAEMQRRGVAHFHAIARLDGVDPADPDAVVPPPAGFDAEDLKALFDHAARTVGFTTAPHPDRPQGWRIGWGEQVLTKVITVAGHGEVTDAQVAAYLAKYATKATEVTGHTSPRLDRGDLATFGVYADAAGSHTQRQVWAALNLGRHPDWRRLRRWAHMLGFGGHFLTKSRRYSITFGQIRTDRIVFRRNQSSGPDTTAADTAEPTVLVVNFLQFVGSGWHTTEDALLANASAQMAREHRTAAYPYPTTPAA